MRYLQSTPPFPALPHAGARDDRPPPAPLLAAAVHAQSEGVLIAARRWTKNGFRILFANESFCAFSGYTVAELRERGHGFLHDSPKELARIHRWQTDVKPGSNLGGEGSLVRKDGARVYSSWNYCPVSDANGKVTHIVATFRDLTEKCRLQDALVHSQRLDAVGRLAGGVAHDFNNLLSVINGYCEMMASKPAVRKLAAHELNEIHLASEKAAHLVSQLLAFSRRQPGNPRVIRLDQLVRDNSDILAKLLQPARHLDLSLQAETASVKVDPAQIQQVLLNLVLNARDALKEGGRAVISTGIREACPDEIGAPKPGNYAVLSVADNGSGMTEEVRAHIFEPFFTTKENGRGTGLGLALVYGVVKQSGGFVRVSSIPGKGSVFEIFLPLAGRPASLRNRTLPSLPAGGGRENILLIEEDAPVRSMVEEVLRAAGYTVVSAATAVEALAQLKASSAGFGLVVAQTGSKLSPAEETFARALHVMLPDVCVLTTGNTDPSLFADLNPARRAALPKPFTLAALLKTSRRLLDTKTPVSP